MNTDPTIIPRIIKTHPFLTSTWPNGEAGMKHKVFKRKLEIKNTETALSKNLMHPTSYSAHPSGPHQITKFLKPLMSSTHSILPMYTIP